MGGNKSWPVAVRVPGVGLLLLLSAISTKTFRQKEEGGSSSEQRRRRRVCLEGRDDGWPGTRVTWTFRRRGSRPVTDGGGDSATPLHHTTNAPSFKTVARCELYSRLGTGSHARPRLSFLLPTPPARCGNGRRGEGRDGCVRRPREGVRSGLRSSRTRGPVIGPLSPPLCLRRLARLLLCQQVGSSLPSRLFSKTHKLPARGNTHKGIHVSRRGFGAVPRTYARVRPGLTSSSTLGLHILGIRSTLPPFSSLAVADPAGAVPGTPKNDEVIQSLISPTGQDGSPGSDDGTS
ncbi:hypothetical protein LX32DRAFT_188421 [Colletotrichum zoysiae]|uniref:Uncharacterized protein n=1 Tax=Colletotrichum zoysiae TaxID=1216348 RepID=A0AAD9LY61_9PEZI|nr:hypothetical protein LX32DRAFT_188421 [Colletotrichum zoysiae]